MIQIKKTSLIILVFLFVASLYSAIESKTKSASSFSLANSPNCQLQASSSQAIQSINNFSHLRGFLIMSLIALFAFEPRRYLKAFIFVFSLSLLTELLQMWSPSRHCRLTDFIPNFLGYIIASVIFYLFLQLKGLLKRRGSER